MTRVSLAVVAGAVLGASAFAAGVHLDARRAAHPFGGPVQGRGGPPSLATVLDGNHDGTVSSEELAAAPAALRTLDTNHDGQLAADELFAGMGRGGPGGRGREGFEGRGGRGGREGGGTSSASADELTDTLMAFDKNEDGKLVRAEVPERFQGLFDRVDTNKDGSLTREEIKTSAAAQAQPQGPPEGGRGGRGGPGMDPVVAALDTNHDGAIAAEEIAAAAQSLKALDRNGDGQLSADETRPAFGRGRGGDRGAGRRGDGR
jgi:Ca2+-binding EF-hand superfamily protein